MEFLIGESHERELLPERIFICFAGKERSRRISRAFNDAGKFTGYVDGGTKRISRLPKDAIQNMISPDSRVTIIYDDYSKDDEFKSRKAAENKLKEANVHYEIRNIMQLMAELHDLDIDINDYF